MQAIVDQGGYVKAWLTHNDQWMVSLTGRPLAYLHKESVYDLSGNHVAWWIDGKVLDHSGFLLFVGPDVPHLRAVSRSYHTRPIRPTPFGIRTVPTLRGKPTRPIENHRWTNSSAFLALLEAGRTAI